MDDLLYIVCPACNTQNRVPSVRLRDKPKCGKCKTPLFSAHPVNLSDANFTTHIEDSTIPVVVDFWAPWCGPCKMMAPAYEQAAAELEPNFRLAKVDTDASQVTAARYAISAIPTMIMFKNGREVARQPGAMPYPSIVQWIRSQI